MTNHDIIRQHISDAFVSGDDMRLMEIANTLCAALLGAGEPEQWAAKRLAEQFASN